jgi:hypothetical protein
MNPRTTRRRFLKAATAAAVLAPAAGIPAAEAGEPAPMPPTPAQALTDLIRARIGKHLTAAQLDRVRQDIANTLRSAEAVNRVALENTEEPALVFVAEPVE